MDASQEMRRGAVSTVERRSDHAAENGKIFR